MKTQVRLLNDHVDPLRLAIFLKSERERVSALCLSKEEANHALAESGRLEITCHCSPEQAAEMARVLNGPERAGEA